MNILLVNHYAGSPLHGMEYRPFFMARAWNAQGHRTRIVASSFSHLRSRQPTANGGMAWEAVEGVEYCWLPGPAYQGNGLGRIRNMLTFLTALIRHRRELTRDFRPDVVIASSTYPLDVYPAASLARAHGAKLVYEVHDLWPMSPMELGGMSRWHPFIATMQIAEDHAYRTVDRVVSMLPKSEAHMRAHGLAPGKWTYVPNGVDVAEWQGAPEDLRQDDAREIRELRRRFPFLVGYAGAHGLANALGTLPEAAALVRGAGAAFVLVGHGPEREALRERCRRDRLDNVLFLEAIPKRAVPSFLALVDAAYVGVARRPLYRFGLSLNKLFDYMMAEKPVICAIQEDAGNDLVAESGCGCSVPPEDPGAVAGAVRQLMDAGPERRAKLGRLGKEYVLRHHSYDGLARRFLDALGA